jgi:hypothetical protein
MSPARKPRTERCCQSVAVHFRCDRSTGGYPQHRDAMMRAWLLSGSAADLDDTGADRLRDGGLAVFRAVELAAAFGSVLGLDMGFSEVYATPSVALHQPSPGRTLKRALAAPSYHSNAPIKPGSQF